MSFLTDRQLSVIDGDKWWGWGLEVNRQTLQYDRRFEQSTKAGSEYGFAGKGGRATPLLQRNFRYAAAKENTLFSLNYTLQYFQHFFKYFSRGLRLSEVKLSSAHH